MKVSIVLASLLLVVFVACGGSDSGNGGGTPSQEVALKEDVKAQLNLSKTSTDIKAGDEFDIIMSIKGATKKIGAVSATIKFDSKYIEIDTTIGEDNTTDTGKGFHKGLATKDYMIMSNINSVDSGEFKFAAITATNHITGNDMQEIIKIHAKAKDTYVSTAYSSIKLNVTEVTDELGKTLKESK
jgi:hypothetical protein